MKYLTQIDFAELEMIELSLLSLKPKSIYRTIYPEKPCENFNTWANYIASMNTLNNKNERR